MHLTEASVPIFARHETFHPRYGWFRKAYSFVKDDPLIFVRDDAPVRIGVGKNMVKSIRFWGLAAKLVVEDPNSPNNRSPKLTTTSLGDRLFGESGWDMYMEDPGTLWLLHWLLLAPPTRLPIWWLAFNDFSAIVFTDDELEAAVTQQIKANQAWGNPHLSSIKKDINVLLRTYTSGEHSGRTGIEDILDCPLRELNLMKRGEPTRHYRFTLGTKSALPSRILLFSILHYICCLNLGGNMMPLSRLANEPGSPGKIFKLSEKDVSETLETISEELDELELVSSVGVRHISWSENPNEIAMRMLNDYYNCSESSLLSDSKNTSQATEID